MNIRKIIATGVVSLAVLGTTIGAQAPVQNIDPAKHANLAAAQGYLVQAYQSILTAQKVNKDQLGDHANKAKILLEQADKELKLAAEASKLP